MSALDQLLEDMKEKLSVAPTPPQPPTRTSLSRVTSAPPAPVRARHNQPYQQPTAPTPATRRVPYTQQRIYRFAAKDGPQHTWRFVNRAKSSDPNVAAFKSHLQRVGNASSYNNNQGGSNYNAWIQEFSPSFIEDIGKEDVVLPDDAQLKIKGSLGKSHFLLRRLDPARKLDWRSLQHLAVKRDFVSRWSNICDTSDEKVVALVRELESKISSSHAIFKDKLTVHVKTPIEGKECRLKYHCVDGQWELLSRNSIAKVFATYDVLMDNAVAFRVRVSTKLPGEEEVYDAVVSHVEINTPPGGDVFHTTVTLRSDVPRGYHIGSFALQKKVYVVHGGMRYMLAYLDAAKSELRLECRLARPHEMNEKASATGNRSVAKQQQDPDEDASIHGQCQRLVRRLLAAIGRP